MSAANEPQPIQEIIQANRLFELLHEGLKTSAIFEPDLIATLIRYTDQYIAFHELNPDQVVDWYNNYIKSYSRDVKAFIREGKYPLELDPERETPAREPYNIILLLSTLFTVHRFRIMQIIQEQTTTVEDGLFVGCGPGIEIELVKDLATNLVAYDLSIDTFLPHAHPSVDFRKTLFDGSGDERYDGIYLIEILEHLADPFALLEACKKVMAPDARLHLTTASNLPQFDHRYNFEPDHKAFEADLHAMGFTIQFMEDIPHAYITTDIEAKNRYYVLGLA